MKMSQRYNANKSVNLLMIVTNILALHFVVQTMITKPVQLKRLSCFQNAATPSRKCVMKMYQRYNANKSVNLSWTVGCTPALLYVELFTVTFARPFACTPWTATFTAVLTLVDQLIATANAWSR
jgi:hypothetical protein